MVQPRMLCARCLTARRLLDQRGVGRVQSAVATAQQKPAGSRAAATAMIVLRFAALLHSRPDVMQPALGLP
jgi:hypothetical protein